MLSKIYHAATLDKSSVAYSYLDLKEAFIDYFPNAKIFNYAPGGTLGILFYALIDEKKYFVKTHLNTRLCRENLIKEITIMKMLYGDLLDTIERIEVTVKNTPYTFLIMDFLQSLECLPDIEDIKKLVADVSCSFEKIIVPSSSLELNCMYMFSHIHSKGSEALDTFTEHNLISYEISLECRKCLKNLESLTTIDKNYLCHGDLSNKNILQKNNTLIIIDWEDAFWGIPGYDICYWMTFFDQRKYYEKQIFNKLCVDTQIGISIMILVVILKSYFSFINNSYINNSLSFDQRIKEILSLL